MSHYTVYADLNCPFCYALHEQLFQFGMLPQIHWCLVEHAPEIATDHKSAENQAELASEVFIVRSRAPTVDVALPKFRSDSRFATLCIIEAATHDPDKAILLRRLLYRALWVEGKDISDPSVIYQCLTHAGLPAEINLEESHEQQLADWQNDWEKGNYKLLLPVLEAADGRSSIGLPSSEDLLAFFKGEEIGTLQQSPEHIPHLNRQTISIYADHSSEVLWPLISALRHDYDILLPFNLSELRALVHDDPPDLLLLSTEQQWREMTGLCQEFHKNKETPPLPIAFLSQEADDQLEMSAYRSGASDFLLLSRRPEILQARISILLQMKQSLEKLARNARIDGLTQVNNRREFERSIETEWRRAQRVRRHMALLMLDVDHFKAFNDIYGHLAGDGCLRAVAKTIVESTQRAQDSVYRYGGEEFAIILPESDVQGAALIAERIRQAIESLQIRHQGSECNEVVTVSIGISCLNPVDGGNPHDLVDQADKALYQAKSAGRNRVVTAPT
ncbi:diguanylate cyclase [Neptuniibacter halophilus]|uniref:diguanylate cyclase n=1 Tax=Neptuniibacter halophilus TaxID=651666 RepID=UPI0025745BCA|nr:diguanylate cyclase [Neptuniibacter halophilus]